MGGARFFHYAWVALALGVACISAPAHAQQQGDDPFCASAPLEMLAALEGPWTLRQGAGFAAAGAMVLPLPAHPPQTVVLEYDEQGWYATLSGMAGEQMVMFPTDENQIEAVVRYLNEADAHNLLQIGAGCDWYSLPLMLGANSYSLARAEGELARISVALGGGSSAGFCVPVPAENLDASGQVSEGEIDWGTGGASVGRARDYPGDPYEACTGDDDPNIPSVGEGQMLMILMVKFQSANSATGLLHFEGEMNGRRFGAKAPISLSR